MGRARAQRPTITCAHCGGHDFVVAIMLNEQTQLRCVNHGDHVAELDLRGKMRHRLEEAGLDPSKHGY